jgi:hypothetical protein
MFSDNSKGSYQSITAAFLPQYRDYSFEELRLEDYVQMGGVQFAQHTEMKWRNRQRSQCPRQKLHFGKNGRKWRVVLPVITKGIINISAVEQLEDKLEKTEAELRDLKMKMDAANAKEQKYLELETELREMKEKVAADSARERKALEERQEAQMKEKLKIRSDKMMAQVEKILWRRY